jgi:hypothetical protein
MMQRIGMAVCAGLAAALLFVVSAKGTFVAVLLACLAPLPIIIATLGWGFEAGGIALIVAVAVVAGFTDPWSGVKFAAVSALPAWLLSLCILFPRPLLFQRGEVANQKKWIPVGGIVALTALLGLMLAAAELASLALSHGGYQKGIDTLTADLIPALTEAFSGAMELPRGVSMADFAAVMVRLFPAVVAGAACLTFCANIYAGARAVQLSQRLNRPWPNLPETLVLSPALGVALIVCAFLAWALNGLAGHLAWAVVGALACGYALQGLAVVHSLSRGLRARPAMLAALYLFCWATSLFALVILALLGLFESFVSLRARRAAAANVKP